MPRPSVRHPLALLVVACLVAGAGAFYFYRSKSSLPAQDVRKPLTPLIPGVEHKADGATPFAYIVYGPDKLPAGRKVPLIVYLHGGGEGGENLNALRRHGPPLLLADGTFPRRIDDFYLVTPQCPSTCRGWPVGDLLQFVKSIAGRYPVDLERITVTGQSMGGIGTFALLGASPESFAGGAALCGRADEQLARTLVNMPLWLIHGALDESIPVSGSRQFMAWLNQYGGTKARYDELPEAGHMIHNEIYRKPEIWEWLLAQVRSGKLK